MAAGDREEVNEGIDVPKAVLNRSRREHEDVLECPVCQCFFESLCDLRRLVGTVEIAEFMGLVEN